jgi:hypothetical protein
MAGTNLSHKFTIEGVDNASAAIDKAKKSLKGLEGQAASTDKATQSIAAKPLDTSKIQQGATRAGGAVAALTGALGESSSAMAVAGKGSNAFGAAMGLIPGPIGLAVAAVAGLGAAAYALGKHLSESEAKLRLLGNAGTEDLADDLGLSVDGAVKLSQAMGDLNDKGLIPSNELMAQIVANAESMGKDGAEAVSAYVVALQGGPDALKAWQKEFGKLRGLQVDKTALVEELGLNAEALGLAKAQTAEATRKAEIDQGVARLQALQVESAKAQEIIAHKIGVQAETNSNFQRLVAAGEEKAARAKSAALDYQIAQETRLIQLIEKEAIASMSAAAARSVTSARADKLDAEARALEAQGKKREARSRADEAATARQLAAQQALNEHVATYGKSLNDAAQQAERLRLETGVIQAQTAKTALLAEKDIKTRAGGASNNKKAAEDDAKARALEAEEADKIADAWFANAQKRKEQEALLSAAVTDLAAYRTEREIKALRDTGNEDAARKAEALERERQYQAELRAIQAQYQKAVDAGGGELETLRAVKDAQEAKALATRDAAAADAEAAQAAKDAKAAEDARLTSLNATIAATQNLTQAFQGVAASLVAVGAQGGSALAAGLGAANANIKSLVESFSQSEMKAKDFATVTAAGADIASAAWGAFQDEQLAKTTERLDREKAAALEGATTEEQRAAITEEFEKKKAEAVEKANRRKAAIEGLMEIAKGTAMMFVPGGQVEAAGHFAAAGIYGLVAGGVLGGGAKTSAGGGSAGGGGGFNTQASSGKADAKGGGSGPMIIYNFNQPWVTKQQIGKVMSESSNALDPTGLRNVRGL